ncbi:TPA: hypothetical protein RNY37_000891 [Pasteurella multocida]|uniref:hypothetical protein n=1 Tax=Pasteurella multocida TaxID=747 RepID=UPI000F6E65D6|nr:hypothetical protein [Pasteurella multocida]MDO5072424.1 hypothetical protein [Pasteurella multocida]MDT8768264.1 hypothetical protein [Pasteurella multocida]URJ87593.1 hypothetical protein M9421_02535 [Pasteurella multocida]URJ89586.1 hypothetical protein M9412_02525 [Pasteurella multocida]URJ92522.1 hypothetical protein M9419_06945 [Pasteurella multocida]
MLKARMLLLLRIYLLLSERLAWVSKDLSDAQVVKPAYQRNAMQKKPKKGWAILSRSARFNLILGTILFILGNLLIFWVLM